MKGFINWCRRYLSIMSVLVIAFMAYTLFFQSNSVFKYMEYTRTVDSLRHEIKQYTDSFAFYRERNRELEQNPEAIERLVREQYHMNRPGEEIYVFE